MVVIKTLVDALHTIWEHPLLILYVGVLTAIQGISASLTNLGYEGAVGLVFSAALLILSPFITAGTLGVMDSSVRGNAPSLTAFWASLKEYGPRLFYILLLLGLGGGALGFVIALSSFIPLLGLFIALGMFALLIVGIVVLQFVNASVVLGDSTTATGAMRASYDFCKRHVGAVLGFMVVRFLLGSVAFIPLAGTPFLQNGPVAPDLLAASILIGILPSVVSQAHYVHFYRKLSSHQIQAGGTGA